MGYFGASSERFAIETDRDFVTALLTEAEQHDIPIRSLDRWNPNDHSAWVPSTTCGPPRQTRPSR